MSNFFSLAIGIGTKNSKGEWLEVFYPEPILHPNTEVVAAFKEKAGYKNGNTAIDLDTEKLKALSGELSATDSKLAALADDLASSDRPVVACLLESDAEPKSTPEAYLKLHLLSHRLVKPHGTNLTGIFPLLPNVAWTNEGAVDLAELTQRQTEARKKGALLEVMSIDKFPKMTNYVTPSGVRIAHTARVRLGAYLGEGTTIMHEGFVNFNAGCEGPNMIEGRISAGVYVDSGSDLGGGCSTMGTLSGGNDVRITVGKDCLIGANAGLGIPLGDRCTIEAGLYLTGSSKVEVIDNEGKASSVVKAALLADTPDLLFIRHSVTGAIQCRTNKSAIALNEELHSHN